MSGGRCLSLAPPAFPLLLLMASCWGSGRLCGLDVDKTINDYAHHRDFGHSPPPPPPFQGFGYPPSRTLHIASVYPPKVCKG